MKLSLYWVQKFKSCIGIPSGVPARLPGARCIQGWWVRVPGLRVVGGLVRLDAPQGCRVWANISEPQGWA